MLQSQIDPKLVDWYFSLPPAQADAFMAEVVSEASQSIIPIWQPNPDRDGLPNPQRLALESEADIVGYGGSAGSGKSNLLLGLAFTQHTRSIIFRRNYQLLKGLIQDSIDLVGNDDGLNKSEHIWRKDNRIIEFGAVQYEDDKNNWRGRPHDFYGFDEVTEFTRTQFEFIIGWLRSTNPKQRCRVIMTFNPPTDESGNWIIDYFLPWIAYLFPDEYQHPNPAKPGELRWFTTIDGKEVERPNGESFEYNGQTIKPLSRTFIPGKLIDNPHLANTNYAAVLQALPEPLRSQVLYGDFAAHKQADPMQVIPTAWVKAAQKRWMETVKPDMPLSGVGVDVSRGGGDKLVISRRYGNWFDEVIAIPGVNVEDGPAAAGKLYDAIKDEKHVGYINIDIIGVGTSAYDSAKVMWPNKVHGVNAAAGSDYVVKTPSGEVVIKMKNLRAEYYWRLRQALDPEHGDNLALPPGNEIVADLCAAKYKWLAGGVVQIEEKDDIKKRIGRSPDAGEAILFAHLPSQTKDFYLGFY